MTKRSSKSKRCTPGGRVAAAGLDVFASEPAFDARYRDPEGYSPSRTWEEPWF